MKRKAVNMNGNGSSAPEKDATNGKRQKLCVADHSQWTTEDLRDFLNDNGLSDLAPHFTREDLTGEDLPYLTEDRLEKIGVSSMGKRLRMMRLLQPILAPQIGTPTGSVRGSKVFNDPIHGHVELHPLCIAVMDTPQFQRLRHIKQLGGCYYVFPGASGNRFEHCIGVCHLAGQLVKELRGRQPELKITDKDILCVELAGLCHDLGHGPFSHMFDGSFIPRVRPGYKWKHEDASERMFDHLVRENELVPVFEKWGLGEKDRTFIKEQIAGPQRARAGPHDWPYQGRPLDKSYLYEIVANKRNGIDVDKWDYFARDCHMLGISNNFDHHRFIKFARVLQVEGEMQICSRDKEVGNLYDMFHTRNALHRRAYQHKTSNLVEEMITEALIKANDHIMIPGKDGSMVRMSDAIDDMEAYTRLTDAVLYQIMYSTSPELQESRDILKKVERRQLYKCVGQTTPIQDKSGGTALLDKMETPTMKSELVSMCSSEELGCKLEPEDIVLHVINLDYGMKDKNPIDHVRFYMKSNPTLAIRVRKDQVSQMLPETFREQHLRVYCKKTDTRSLEAATKCFHRWCAKKGLAQPKGGDTLSVELTPIKTSPTPCAPIGAVVTEDTVAVETDGEAARTLNF